MLDFLNFLRQKMSEYLGFAVKTGSNIDELHLKPNSLLLTDFYNLLVRKQTMDDIANWQKMSDDDMNFFGAKFFYPRVNGNYSSGGVRVWVDISQDYLISSNFRAVAGDGTSYRATIPGTVRSGSLSVSGDAYGKYYFDVMVQSVSTGSAFNKTAGQITNITGVDFQFKFVTNPKNVTASNATETNQQYYDRLRYGLNDRSMTNNRSIYAGLRNIFPIINSVYVAGAGNAFMTRDLIQAVDLSAPPRQTSYLGKTQGDAVVKNVAFYGTFPDEPWSQGAGGRNPLAISSAYRYPQTIDAVDPGNPDPAYHGYPIFQEATDDMYRGLYYDDFIRFMQIQTRDMLNVVTDIINNNGAATAPPGWMIGANGHNPGDFGLGVTQQSQVVIDFENLSDIVFKGVTASPVSAVKDILKRVGVKLSGRIVPPSISAFSSDGSSGSSDGSSIQIGIGGQLISGTGLINSFSGLGFGILMSENMDTTPSSTKTNATVFFCNNSGIDTSETYKNTSIDSYGYLTSILEIPVRIAPGNQYDFEFIVYGDASLSLSLTPTLSGILGDGLPAPATYTPAADSVLTREYVNSQNSSNYGSLCVATVNSKSQVVTDTWSIKSMKAVDTTAHWAHSLFMFNIDGLEEPIDIVFRGYGQGYSNNAVVRGHSAYIWNLEIQGPITGLTSLSSGGWELLSGISDTGVNDAISNALQQRIKGLDKYTVNTRYGNVVIVMVVSTGSSHAGSVASGDVIGDVNAQMVTDYIRLSDAEIDAFHGNNKCDVYVDTVLNSDTLKLETISLQKQLDTDYFIISAGTGNAVPVADIVSIFDTDTGVQLQSQDYSVTRGDAGFMYSAKDIVYINAPNYNNLTINYHTYPGINEIQEYFDGRDFGRLVGSYLAKHKAPVYIDISFSYSGNVSAADLGTDVNTYFDTVVDKVFDVNDMLNYLFTNGFISNVMRPVTPTFQTVDGVGNTITGTITNTYTITDVQFFRVRSLTLTQVGGAS